MKQDKLIFALMPAKDLAFWLHVTADMHKGKTLKEYIDQLNSVYGR